MYLIVGITLKTHTGDKIKLISVINHDNRHFLIFRNDCLSLNVTCRFHMHKFVSVLCDAPDFNLYFQFLISDDNTALGDKSNPEHALFIVKLCYMYMCMCVCVCVYVYVRTCIYIYIHLFVHIMQL